jgi:hypothetical protein
VKNRPLTAASLVRCRTYIHTWLLSATLAPLSPLPKLLSVAILQVFFSSFPDFIGQQAFKKGNRQSFISKPQFNVLFRAQNLLLGQEGCKEKY